MLCNNSNTFAEIIFLFHICKKIRKSFPFYGAGKCYHISYKITSGDGILLMNTNAITIKNEVAVKIGFAGPPFKY